MRDIAQRLLVGADIGNASVLGTIFRTGYGERVARPDVAGPKGPGVFQDGELRLSNAAQETGAPALEALGLVFEEIGGAGVGGAGALLLGVAQVTGRAADLRCRCTDVGGTGVAGASTLLLGIAVTPTGVADCGSGLFGITRAVNVCTSAQLLLRANKPSGTHVSVKASS
jgi:hypothetical protein